MIERATRMEQLAGELEEAILTGRLAKGEVLPSERKLAELYRLSRATVRAATQRLIAKGLVVQVAGEATVVAEGPWTFDRLVDRIHAEQDRPQVVHLVADLLAVRTLFLAEVAVRACESAADADELHLLVDELRRQIARGALPRMVNRVERQLFDVLVSSCGSVALEMLVASSDRLHDSFPHLVDALPGGLWMRPDSWASLASLVERRASRKARELVRSALADAEHLVLAAFEPITPPVLFRGE